MPRTIEGEGAPIAAAAHCCMPPLLLLLPAACAHCWRMTATIARRCHLVWVLHVHVSSSSPLSVHRGCCHMWPARTRDARLAR